ncbi:MAG: OmpA family protein [Bryobacteraceae bacterium]|nr:OmpA family protein [Bryobacteraceae bacterium]
MRVWTVLPLMLLAGAAAQDWDFVPGARLLLYDDFTDVRKGAAPPHWKVRGAGVALDVPGRLRASETVRLTPNITQWPPNFTVEQEFLVEKVDQGDLRWEFGPSPGDPELVLQIVFFPDDHAAAVELKAGDEKLGDAQGKWLEGAPNSLQIWTQEGRVRIYLNGARLIDVNQVTLAPPKFAMLELDPTEGGAFTLLRARIAESSPDFSETLLATGRYVSHGIHFDVNSDRLRQESYPVIESVARALEASGALRLRIEGHTDSTGDPARNLDLSARRAESVKRALVERHRIGPERLETRGLGQTQPLEPNDTPRGRAQNRRVEFVKL